MRITIKRMSPEPRKLETVLLLVLLVISIGLQSSPAQAFSLTVTSDKDMYAKGQTASISGTLKNGGSPIVGADIAIEVTNSLGSVVFEQQLKTDSNGGYSTPLLIPNFWLTGLYTIHAAYQSDRATAYFLIGYGLLRAPSSPAVQTTIFVDNTPRDDWGLNWVKLTPGTYKLHFTNVPGFATPANQTVVVTEGQVTTVQAVFTQFGALHVVTNPPVPATISIDGNPRDDWGVWLPLSPGLHTVHFGDVANFITPSDQQVNVVAGTSVTVTGNYVAGTNSGPTGVGLLRVVTSPAVQSSIYVNNVLMDDWGLNWVELPPGTYTIHFSDVPGYASPANQTVTVTADQTTIVTGAFTQIGALHVITNPPVPATIYINGVPMDDWGVWVELPAGTYTVSFGDVAGYTTPADQVVTVIAGTSVTVTGNYT